VTGPGGETYAFGYDGPSGNGQNNNLTSITYPDQTTKIFFYNEAAYASNLPNHLTGIQDENGARFAIYRYAWWGGVYSSEHANGAEKGTLSYTYQGPTTVTDALGAARTYQFANILGVRKVTSISQPAGSGSAASLLSFAYDANGNRTCRKDEEGRVTTWTYNTTNQKLSETSGRTGTCSSPVTTPATRTTTYAYLAPNLDLPTVVESPSVAGSGFTKRTEITYDATLKVPRVITQKGYTPEGVAVSRTITLDYNTSGQVKSIDGPRTDVNDVTTLEYYECTTGRECGQLKSVTNALNQKTTYDVYDGNGRLIEMTEANGLKTFLSYDPRGRLWSVTYRAPGGESRMTSFLYDAAGNVTEAKTPDGRVLTYTYDAAHYLRTVTDNLGNRVEYGYDLKGNRTATKTYDPQGTLVRSIELAYDARNRVMEVNDGGSITQQVWDAVGNLTKITDPNTVAALGTAATVNEYDALNRLFKTTDRLSGVTAYGYDSSDRVKQVTAPNAATTGYAVDDLGNVLKETSPDRGVLTYGYDQAGNVTSLLDARGITVSYNYDALNRLTTADFPGTEEDLTYSYDTGCTNGAGRLCTVVDASGTSAYTYDGFGNVATHTRTEFGVSATTGYGYDPLNRVASITYPDGRKVTYDRNTLGQVTEVTLTQNGSTQTLASNLQYRADGLPTNLTYGNGLNESRLYTLAGRLETWTVGNETRGLIYDANGNLKEKTGTATATFSYDALDRLKDETLTGLTQGFTYDANGNRKSDGLGTYDYLAQSNRLSTTPNGAITLDAAGNVTAQGNRSFSYFGNGQLRDITEAGTVIAAYAYNSERQRTRKTVNGETTVYHYDLAGHLLMETDAAGTPKRAYVWVNGRPLALLDTGTVTYLHTDQLDTPRLATNSAGTTVWRWEGEAFGNTVPSEDPDQDGTTTTVNLRFPGQYYDQETGLHYNWNRYYDPKLGRYITSDPVGLRGGLNSYTYTGSNPLRWSDAKGLVLDDWEPSGSIDGDPLAWGMPGSAGSPCGSGFSFPAFSFGPACIRHDECYGTCGANKTKCDFEFLWNMQQSCSPGDWSCRLLAQAYFEGVLHGGHFGPYRNAQAAACKGCKQ
jgi:RHS repeat-associated protein